MCFGNTVICPPYSHYGETKKQKHRLVAPGTSVSVEARGPGGAPKVGGGDGGGLGGKRVSSWCARDVGSHSVRLLVSTHGHRPNEANKTQWDQDREEGCLCKRPLICGAPLGWSLFGGPQGSPLPVSSCWKGAGQSCPSQKVDILQPRKVICYEAWQVSGRSKLAHARFGRKQALAFEVLRPIVHGWLRGCLGSD